MKAYNYFEKECEYGHYNTDGHARYTVTDADKLSQPWYYIYQNRKILVYLDQNGPVKIQHNPPYGIFVIKRELCEKYSKFQFWVKSKAVNGGIPVSNFNTKSFDINGESPVYTVDFSAETATYKSVYKNAVIQTEIFTPMDAATVSFKTTVTNKSDKEEEFTVSPSFLPYINVPQMVAWDLPEWYLRTEVKNNGKQITFSGISVSPDNDKAKNKSVTFNMDCDNNTRIELDYARFSGSGSFFTPIEVLNGSDYYYNACTDENIKFSNYQSVYAAKYIVSLKPNQSKTFTQVISIQDSSSFCEQQNSLDFDYFDNSKYLEKVEKAREFYGNLFSKRSIKTSNPLLDKFINEWTPLQMYWVCSLDRGWPTSMRGVRDASQDFIGMTPIDPDWSRQIILELFSFEDKNGWLPRQVNVNSRSGPHDLRHFSDSAAFLLEFLNDYIRFTRDYGIFDEQLEWFDLGEKASLAEHVVKCIDHYIDDNNIGEHGLCKVWYGDWWDTMDNIGMKGRGESVSVTAQVILCLENFAEIFSKLNEQGRRDFDYPALSKLYLEKRESFKKSMLKNAYNSRGFFNGYFNDNGKWLLSDNDPDGIERLYLVSNAWALISGICDEKTTASVVENVENRNYYKNGYRTQSIPFYTYIENAGREGGCSALPTATYNHAQSFIVRAYCAVGEAEKAYKASRYIYPFESKFAPVSKTLAPPYAITNCYDGNDQSSELVLHRAGFQFLSGTVSYVLRTFYNFFFGIDFELDGLRLKPCIPKDFGDCEANFSFLGKKFTVKFVSTSSSKKTAKINGKPHNNTKKDAFFFEDECFENENIIEIEI